MTTFKINFYDTELVVEGYYIEGDRGDYETPATPDEFEVHKVYQNDEDLTNLIQALDAFEAIEEVINQKINS